MTLDSKRGLYRQVQRHVGCEYIPTMYVCSKIACRRIPCEFADKLLQGGLQDSFRKGATNYKALLRKCPPKMRHPHAVETHEYVDVYTYIHVDIYRYIHVHMNRCTSPMTPPLLFLNASRTPYSSSRGISMWSYMYIHTNNIHMYTDSSLSASPPFLNASRTLTPYPYVYVYIHVYMCTYIYTCIHM